VCLNLGKTDYITSTHRGHGHTLAKGASMQRMMCELFGRATGCNGGKGGSMHIADFSVGMLGANGVVAAGIPIAVGAAHALKIQGSSSIVACFFGDGAVNRGPFLEGLNWAKVHALPLLFVCEDNRWSATTATGAMTAGAGALARARAIGVPGMEVDGNDVIQVYGISRNLMEKIRSGEGPQFLHAITYRFKGHVSVDPASYRDGEEVSRALENDPLKLVEKRIAAGEAASIRKAAEEEVRQALAAAAAAPWPEPAAAYTDIQDAGAGRWR
ncbi:MAG: acetoin dehydrogenase, partial [Betaproteobacteria bacterium RIFCSPLOWO2_12_FULL_68_19]